MPSSTTSTSRGVSTVAGVVINQPGRTTPSTSTSTPTPGVLGGGTPAQQLQGLLDGLTGVGGVSTSTSTPTPGVLGGGTPAQQLQALLDGLTGVEGASTSTSTPTPGVLGGGTPLQQIQGLLSGLSSIGGTSTSGTSSPGGMHEQFLRLLLQQTGGSGGLSQTSNQFQQLFHLLAQATNPQGGSPTNPLGNTAAMLNLLSTTGSPLGMTASLAQIIYAALTSPGAKKASEFCYNYCGEACQRNCCCPTCGCPDGQCGCGGFGRFCCGLWKNCCGIGDASEEIIIPLEELEELEKRYGKAILLTALAQLGIDTMSLLSGQRLDQFPSMMELVNACEQCSRDFYELLEAQSMDLWVDASDFVKDLLEDSFWKQAIVAGISKDSSRQIETNFEEKILVIPSLGEQGGESCSYFNMKRLCMTFPKLRVHSPKAGDRGAMGVGLAAKCMNILATIFLAATHGGKTPVWITKQHLMALIIVVLASCGYYFLPATGNPDRGNILNDPAVTALLKECYGSQVEVGRRREAYRTPGGKVTAKVRHRTDLSKDFYKELAFECFDNYDKEKKALLEDSSSAVKKDKSLAEISVVTQPQPQSTGPGVTPPPSRRHPPSYEMSFPLGVIASRRPPPPKIETIQQDSESSGSNEGSESSRSCEYDEVMF